MKYEFFSFHPLFPYFHCWAVSRTPSPARLQLDMRAMENEKKIIIWSSSYSWEEKSPKICWWTFRIHVCKIAENWKSISHPKVMREQPPSVCIARDWNWHNLSNKIVSFKGNFPQATAVSTALRLYILSKWHISTKLSWVFIWRIPTTPQKGWDLPFLTLDFHITLMLNCPKRLHRTFQPVSRLLERGGNRKEKQNLQTNRD